MIITCYSYKGGSGRSTAAANIAGSLFRKGLKVACLDLDFGAPGLHEILKGAGDRKGKDEWDPVNKNVKLRLEKCSGIGLHHFFNKSEASGNDGNFIEKYGISYKDLVVKETDNPTENFLQGMKDFSLQKLNKGEMIFITASRYEKSIDMISGRDYDLRKFRHRFYELVAEIIKYFYRKENNGEDIKKKSQFDEFIKNVYIICDSASGITGNSLPVLNLSNLILTFFRWSGQHLAGTEETCKSLKCYLEERFVFGKVRFYKVGSISYSVERLQEKLKEKKEKDVVMNEALKRLEKHLEELNQDFDFRYLGDIPEDDSMKFFERIITLSKNWTEHRDLIDAYDHVAESLIIEREKVDYSDAKKSIWECIQGYKPASF